MKTGESMADFEGQLRHIHFYPNGSFTVLFENFGYLLGFSSGNLAMEDVLHDGVGPLCPMQRGKPKARMLRHMPMRVLGVRIRQIERNKNACVRVDGQ